MAVRQRCSFIHTRDLLFMLLQLGGLGGVVDPPARLSILIIVIHSYLAYRSSYRRRAVYRNSHELSSPSITANKKIPPVAISPTAPALAL